MIKRTIRRAIHFSGVNSLSRKIYSNYPRIIMFHKICSSRDPEDACMTTNVFRQYLKYIKRYYYPMRVCDLVNSKSIKGAYPKNAVAVTFDDGFQSFYDFAWPLLQEFDIPATIFVVPGLVGKEPWLWPDKISYIYDNGLKSFTEKTKNELLAEMKKMTSVKRETYITTAAKTSGISMPENIPAPFKLMPWHILKELSESKLIEIGSHTLTHPIMSNENADVSWDEIYLSRSILEKKLGKAIHSFAYPNGQIGDYSLEQTEMIREAGYCCGIAAHFGFVTPGSNAMALPRIGGEHVDVYSFYKYLDGIEYMLRKQTHSHCELCLQEDFENRIKKEYCIKKDCFNSGNKS